MITLGNWDIIREKSYSQHMILAFKTLILSGNKVHRSSKLKIQHNTVNKFRQWILGVPLHFKMQLQFQKNALEPVRYLCAITNATYVS